MTDSKHLLAACLLLTINTIPVQAALFDRGGGLIYNDTLNITWLADANLFKTQHDADNSILDALIGQTVADSYYGTHTVVAADYYTATGQMTWWGAQAWAANLNYGGYSDWRLPTSNAVFEYDAGSELGHLLYNELGGKAGSSIVTQHDADYALFVNLLSHAYWSSNEYALNTSYAWDFNASIEYQYTTNKYGMLHAWAVRTGDVAVPGSTNNVPEPGSVALLSVGLFVLLWAVRRGRRGDAQPIV